MTEADFEREANKLLRDLGLPSDTLNFFESDSANTTNWKSTIKAPSPPKVRRVSSSGAATQRQRDRMANGPTSLRRPERSSIPWRVGPKDSDSGRSSSVRESSNKSRFSTGSPGVPTSSGSLSQPLHEQNSSEKQPQTTTTSSVQPRRQVHRPAPRAPPPNYQSRRASTPGRSSLSPAGHASKSPSPAPNQGSGIPVLSQRRISSAAATSSTSANAAAANPTASSASSSTQKHTVKTVLHVSRPPPPVVARSREDKADVESEQDGFHAYESIDGNVKNGLMGKSSSSSSSSQHKSASFKKTDTSLNAPKQGDITRRLSAPEKTKMQPVNAAASETQQERNQSSSSHNNTEILRRLSRPARTSTKKSEQKSSKLDDKVTTTSSSKSVRPERTSVLSYSRIPVTSSPSKAAPPPPPQSEIKGSSSSSSGGSKIPQPGVSRSTWSGRSRPQPAQQKQEGKSSRETKLGGLTYNSLSSTPAPGDALGRQKEEVVLPEVPGDVPKANLSGAYDRLTAKEIEMIMQDIDLPKVDGKEATPEREQVNGVADSSSDPFEHLYAKVDKTRRYSDDQGTSENRHSLTSPISDPGTADPNVAKLKRHSADETARSSRSNPPSRKSSRELRSSGSGQNGRSLSVGSNPTTASSPESLADRQTPDSGERKSKININWTKPTLDSNMNAVATSTVQALQTLVEVMSPVKKDKRFPFEGDTLGTPWYLLDTEENDESGESSHPLSPSGEPVTSPTNMTQSTKVTTRKTGKATSSSAPRSSSERRSSGQPSESSRRTSNASNSQGSPPQTSSKKTSLSSQDSPRSRGNKGVNSDAKDHTETRKTSQTGIAPPLPVSRTLSSPEHDYAILEGPEPDYDILDPEMSKEFYGYCAHCKKAVIGMETGCLALDDVYHLKCFNCTKCHASLSGQHFYVLDNCIVCEADFLRTLERCHACKRRIQDRVLRACGQCYHPDCFRCVVCGLCLDGVPYIVSNSHKVYCIHDYYKKHAPRCAVCGDSIIPKSGRTKSLKVTASGRSYHVECYRCEDCGKQLASKGGSEKCYPIERHLYCRECNAARVYQWYKMNSDYQQEPGLIV